MRPSILPLGIGLALAAVSGSGWAVRASETTSSEQNNIVNGNDVPAGRFPYVSSLQSPTRHECGGVLVAPDMVATAAHCLDNNLVEVRVGRRSQSDPDSEKHTIASKIAHPNYDRYDYYDSYDIALLKLNIASSIEPVRLNDDPDIPNDEGDELSVLGWGDDGSGQYSDTDILQEGDVQYIPNDVCKKSANYEPRLEDNMMCALGENTDACAGDSGGPLIVKGDDSSEDLLVGTVSWGVRCAVYPGVYSRVSYSYDWLASMICQLSIDPPAYLKCLRAPSSPAPVPKQPSPRTLPPIFLFATTTSAPVPATAPVDSVTALRKESGSGGLDQTSTANQLIHAGILSGTFAVIFVATLFLQ